MSQIVLRRRRDLAGKPVVIQLIRRLRDAPQVDGPLAKLARDQRTEDLSEEDLMNAIRRLTGENPEELLQMAGRDNSKEELQYALHHTIIMCNEMGQPLEQEPNEPAEPPQERKKQKVEETPKAEGEVRRELAALRAQHVESSKAQLVSLASAGATEPVILASLDALINVAQKANHPDSHLYQNLRAHALRLRGQLSIPDLLIEVLGDKMDDRISAAISRGLKEQRLKRVSDKKVDKEKLSNDGQSSQKPPETQVNSHQQVQSPPQWPSYQWPPFYPQSSSMGGFQMSPRYPQSQSFSPQGFQPQTFQAPNPRRKKLSCYACGGEHLMRDCDMFKQLKKDTKE